MEGPTLGPVALAHNLREGLVFLGIRLKGQVEEAPELR